MLNILKKFYDLHGDLPFLPERMKIKKWNKLVCNFYDKNNYVVHIRTTPLLSITPTWHATS